RSVGASSSSSAARQRPHKVLSRTLPYGPRLRNATWVVGRTTTSVPSRAPAGGPGGSAPARQQGLRAGRERRDALGVEAVPDGHVQIAEGEPWGERLVVGRRARGPR